MDIGAHYQILTCTLSPPIQGRIWQTKHILCWWGAAEIWVWYVYASFVDVTSWILLLVQDEDDLYNLHTMPDAADSDEGICLPSSTSTTPSTSGSGSLSTRTKTTSKMPSQASTPRLRTMTKWSLQDAFAEESVKDSQMLGHLGT